MALNGILYIAPPCDDEMAELISDALSMHLGEKLVLAVQEDESLIGGFRATINGKMYDASILAKTNRILAHLRSNS